MKNDTVSLSKIGVLLKGMLNYNFICLFKPLAPTELQVNITYLCNSRCVMCNIWKRNPKKEMSLKQWEKALRDPIFKSIERLSIAGGEPTLHPRFEKLTRLLIDCMPNLKFLSLITNGFSKKKVISSVKSMISLTKGRDIDCSVSISLDGIGKTHDLLRNTPGAYSKTSETIHELKKLQKKSIFWIIVGCLVCRSNLHEVKKVEQWCRRRKIPFYLQLVGFHKTYVENLNVQEKISFRKKDLPCLLKLMKSQILNLQSDWKAVMTYYWADMFSMYKNKTKRTTPCPFVYDAFVIDSLGDVYYCLSEKKIGSVLKGKSVSSIYYDQKNLKFRKWMTKNTCFACNSACSVGSAIRKDFKKYFFYKVFGKGIE